MAFDIVKYSAKTTPRLANAIRRYSMNRIPIIAIDQLMIYENRTAYFDEYISHRIGQIPLINPTKDMDTSSVGFYLDVTGPTMIYSKELKSNNETIKVAIEDMPLVTLQDNQSLRIEGYVKKGIGREHAKFQASVTSYELKDDGTYEFFVESLGQIPAKTIAKKAIDILIEDLESSKKSLKEM